LNYTPKVGNLTNFWGVFTTTYDEKFKIKRRHVVKLVNTESFGRRCPSNFLDIVSVADGAPSARAN